MKVPEWLKKVGDYLLTGAKSAIEATSLIGNLVAEGAGELIEKGLEKTKDKIDEHKLYRSASKKLEMLAEKYNEKFWDNLYADICAERGDKMGKPSTGKEFAQFILGGMDRIDEKTIEKFPSCKILSEVDKRILAEAFLEFKQWLCQHLLDRMDQKEQAFIQVIAQKVVNEVGGEVRQVFQEIGVNFYGKTFRPLDECPNCHSTGNALVQDAKNMQTHCKNCNRSFYAGEQTDVAEGFRVAINEELVSLRDSVQRIEDEIKRINGKIDDILDLLRREREEKARIIEFALAEKRKEEEKLAKRTPWICPGCGFHNGAMDNYCQRCGEKRPE